MGEERILAIRDATIQAARLLGKKLQPIAEAIRPPVYQTESFTLNDSYPLRDYIEAIPAQTLAETMHLEMLRREEGFVKPKQKPVTTNYRGGRLYTETIINEHGRPETTYFTA